MTSKSGPLKIATLCLAVTIPSVVSTPAQAQVPEVPNAADLEGLLDQAEKLSGEDLGEVRKTIKSMQGRNKAAPAKEKAAAAKAPSNGKVPRVMDLPLPEDAGVEYERVTRFITVTSADDVKTLAQFFINGLGDLGWQETQKPLITNTAAIIKMSLGNANVTIMAKKEGKGSEATITTKGMAWDSIPESRIAKRKPEPEPENEPDSADSPDDEKPKPAKLHYAANISADEQRLKGASMRTENNTRQLTYGVAYQAVDGDDQKTEILLSTKPINVAKVVALLNNGQDGGDALGFDPCLKLRFDDKLKLSYLFMYADGLSVNLGGQGEDTVESNLTIENGRAKGQARLVNIGKLFEKEYTFTAPFDVKLITGTAGATPTPGAQPTDELGAEDYSGIPIPLITTNRSSIGSTFRKTVEVLVPAPLAEVAKFYRRELSSRGWKEDAKLAKLADESANLTFSGADGSLTVQLSKAEEGTQATIAARYPAKATAAGITPQPGKGRIILANAGEKEVTLVINGQQYKVPAGKGVKSPKDGVSLHVQPGAYTVVMKSTGADSSTGEQSEKVKVAAGETWGVIATPIGGYIADQLY